MDYFEYIKKVKEHIAKKKPTYNQSGWVGIAIDGKSYNVRTDCTGYISAVISFLRGKSFITSSYGLAYDKNVATILKKLGFRFMKFPGWSKLQKGDILVDPGHHAEIFANHNNGLNMVWSCGSTSSLRNSSYGRTSGTHNFKYIWRYKGKK